MAVMQASGHNSKELLRRNDEIWLQSVLDLIPRSVYGEDPFQASLKGRSEKSQKDVKRSSSSEKKRRAKNGELNESSDDKDSKHASLKKKLHKKIQEKRTSRKADEESYVEARAARKRKRDEKSSLGLREGKRIRAETKNVKERKQKAKTKEQDDGDGRENRKRKLAEDEDERKGNLVALETTRVAGFDTDKPVRKVKRKKLRGSKLVELQKKLVEANKEKELSEGTELQTTDKCEVKENDGRKREMEKAMQRARGIDVKDDVKKLKKSIRKEKRRTEKSREEWARRKKTQETEQTMKQEKRKRSLNERRSKNGSRTK